MLVVLYFHQLGYGPLEIALLFLFYEFFGVVANLFGGWAAARTGLAATFVAGLALLIVALSMLLTEPDYLSVAYVMAAQALSGIAKDLNKLSAKSSVKLLAGDREGLLFRWVAWLAGSKNALKGAGFLLGGTGLSLIGFQASIATMAISLGLVAIVALLLLDWREGRASFKPKFSDVWSKSEKINLLAAARLFLFGSRDVWFVVALPVFLQIKLGWSSFAVGSFLAAWIIGYGAVQVLAPSLTAINNESQPPDGLTTLTWALSLAAIPVVLAIGLNQSINPELLLITGLITFGAVFALNSAIHS